MKTKRLAVILGAIAVGIALASCASTPPGVDRPDVPAFYLDPPRSEDMLFGVGQAKMATLDLSRSTVLVSYDVHRVLDAAQGHFMRNESAAFAEFKAEEALRRLDAEIQNSPPRRWPGACDTRS